MAMYTVSAVSAENQVLLEVQASYTAEPDNAVLFTAHTLYRIGSEGMELKNFLLTPEEWYEERGFVPNVTFPCATIHDAETGKIAIYYGAADTYVGLAFTTVDLIVDYIKKNSVVRESDTEIGRR